MLASGAIAKARRGDGLSLQVSPYSIEEASAVRAEKDAHEKTLCLWIPAIEPDSARAFPMTISCGKCRSFLKTVKIGLIVCEHTDEGPYQLWSADEMQCPRCGSTVLVYGVAAFVVRGQKEFATLLADARKRPANFREVRF